MSTHFTIEGSAIYDIASFYGELNRVFMAGEDWQLGQSLDALNDLLHGGFGLMKGEGQVVIHWKDMAHSREALGYPATKRYYEGKLLPDSPFNKEHFRKELEALEAGTGKTYFDIVMEIIGEHPRITIIAEN